MSGCHFFWFFLAASVGVCSTLPDDSSGALLPGYVLLLPKLAASSAGLCQISEFSFVLASRGTRMGLISQPVYFLYGNFFVASVWDHYFTHFSAPKKKINPRLFPS